MIALGISHFTEFTLYITQTILMFSLVLCTNRATELAGILNLISCFQFIKCAGILNFYKIQKSWLEKSFFQNDFIMSPR